MKIQTVDSKDKPKKRDPDFIMAEIAMKGAARKSRERAMRINTGVFIVKDGQIDDRKSFDG